MKNTKQLLTGIQPLCGGAASRRGTKVLLCLLACCLAIVALLPVTVHADTAPKPSVRVSFENLGDELCYATLLSDKPSTGPWSVLDEANDRSVEYYTEYYESTGVPENVWRRFTEYRDADGFYFLQQTLWVVSETKELAWTYYPPNAFKVLLYFPARDTFAVSGIYERYAFDSYYTVDAGALSKTGRIVASKSYRWGTELLNLGARFLITVCLELLVALLFGIRGKKPFLFLLAVNAGTQLILNILLNVIVYKSGPAAFVVWFILLELVVTAVEAALYATVLRRLTGSARSAGFFIVYALVANAVSFTAGLLLARFIPGIF